MKLVVMGAPGSGKGSQCPAITERYDICHLSTGDICAGTQNAVRQESPSPIPGSDTQLRLPEPPKSAHETRPVRGVGQQRL